MNTLIRTSMLALAVSALGLFGCSSSSSSGTTPAASDGTGTGPGATLLCSSSGKNAWETFGATAFVAVNESIFTNVNAEIAANSTKNLGTSFTLIGTGKPASTTDDLAKFKGQLAAFLVFAYGGPSSIQYTDGITYTADADLKDAHTGLAITADQYNYFVTSIIVPSLTQNGVTSEDVSSCFAPLVTSASVMAEIVGQ